MKEAIELLKNYDVWRFMPHLLASHISKNKWVPYHYLKHISNAVVDAIVNGDGRLIVTMPPRHGKSELISHWLPVWHLVSFPTDNIILVSYEADFAANWGRKCRDTIMSHPELGLKIRGDISSASRWETTHKGGMLAAGAGGAITGRGGNLIVCDDLHKNWQEVQSETYRKRVQDWFQSVLLSRCEPGATILIIGTRWHHDDLIGYLLREYPDTWAELRFPAICETPTDILGRKEGDPLCPERYDREALQEVKESVGSIVWTGMYQQRPTPAEGAIFKSEWFRYYDKLPKFFHNDISRKIQSWDTALKTGSQHSYSVCQTWLQCSDGKKWVFYLLDQFRKRMEYPDLKREVINQYKKHRPDLVLVEDKASGISVIQDIKRETYLPLEPVQPEHAEAKAVRATIISSLIESGRVYFPKETIWIDDFIDELLTFPGSRFADQVDALSQALNFLKGKWYKESGQKYWK